MRFQSINRSAIPSFFMAMTLFIVTCGNLDAKTDITIDIGGLNGSTCQESPNSEVIVAGSMCGVAVSIIPRPRTEDLPFSGFTETKPDWLSLEFGRIEGETYDREFIVDKNLTSLLNPVYYLNHEQAEVNQRWQNGIEPTGFSKRLVCHFQFKIPDSFQDPAICVRAIVSNPLFGELSQQSGPFVYNMKCIDVVLPCSEEDETQVLASEVCFAYRRRDDLYAIQLAKDLIEQGRTTFVGLRDAMSAARSIKDYNSELLLLDAMYSKFGYIRNLGDQPVPVDNQEESYMKMRQLILHKIAEQEQQQK